MGVKILGGIDESNNAVVVENAEEYFTHVGRSFWAETSVDVDSDGVSYISGSTDGGRVCIKKRYVSIKSANAIDIEMELYEGGTFTGGENVAALNKNRCMKRLPTFTIKKNASPDLTGSQKMPTSISIVSDKKFSVSDSSDIEYGMKPDENYFIKITNNGVSTSSVSIMWVWYELDKENCYCEGGE